MAEPTDRDLERSAYSFLQHLDKLEDGGKNFKAWKIRMLKALELAEVDDIVLGKEKEPESTASQQEKKGWTRKSRRALALITTKLSEEEIVQIEGLDAPAAWSFLKNKYEMRTQDIFKTIYASLKLVSAKTNDDVPTHLQEHERILAEARKSSFPLIEPAPAGADEATRMKHVGINMCYSDFIFDGLPKTTEWDTFRQVYEGSEETSYAPREVLDKIRAYHQKTSARTVTADNNPLLSSSSSSSGTALATTKGSPRPICPFCHRKKPNHPPEKCFDNAANPDNKLKEKEKAKKEEEKERKKAQKKAAKAAAAAAKANDTDTHLTIAAASVSSTLKHDDEGWFLDSCASSSLAHSRSSSKTYTPSADVIKTATGADMKVVGVGDVELLVKVGSATKKVTFKDVHHVPSSAFNLISVPKITKAGCVVVFSPDGKFEIKFGGKVILTGVGKDYGLPRIALAPAAAVAAAAGSSEERLKVVRIVHRRYGHPGKGQLRDLLKSGAVKDFSTVDLDAFYETDCTPCRMGKASKLSFPTSPNRAERPLERIHSDLAGPVPVESYGGCRYFAILFDEASGWVEARPMKSKEEVPVVVKAMLESMKQEFKSCDPPRFRVFQSDQGTEYLSSVFQTFLSSEGYKHETSIAYRPQQNGRSERAIRTVKEKVTTLLAEAGISRRYWAEALF
jgi:hypothetical protein